MKGSTPFDPAMPRLFIRVSMLFCTLLLFWSSPVLGNERSSKDELIESIHQRVRDLNSRMREMGASNLPPVEARYAPESLNEKYFFEEPKLKSSKFSEDRKKSIPSTQNKSFEPNTGFYFLPFGGIALADEIEWTVLGEIASIEAKEGYSLGASFGYRWKYFYLEERISHIKTNFKLSEKTGISDPINGEASNLTFHQSIGLNFNFNSWFGLQIGGGAGICQKDILITSVNGLSIINDKEDDWVFSYDGTVGIFFQPGGYFRCGINYRWLRSEGLERFSATDMHLIELALGLQF